MLIAIEMVYNMFDILVTDPDSRGIHLRTYKMNLSLSSRHPVSSFKFHRFIKLI